MKIQHPFSIRGEQKMTTLDKRIPYYPVLMTLAKTAPIEVIPLAQGYRFVAYDDRYIDEWIRLHVMLGQLASIEEGYEYFKQTFLTYPQALKKQMIFLVDEQGRLAGTSSIWSGMHFGRERLRVHWVGVHPSHQRKGLARSLMLKTIAMYEELHQSDALYLTTQTNSYVAIRLYEQLGFVAYMEQRPERFHEELNDTYACDMQSAWKLIHEKIRMLEHR